MLLATRAMTHRIHRRRRVRDERAPRRDDDNWIASSLAGKSDSLFYTARDLQGGHDPKAPGVKIF